MIKPKCPKCGKAIYPNDIAYANGKEYHSKCQKQVCYEARLKRSLENIHRNKRIKEKETEIQRCRRTKGM